MNNPAIAAAPNANSGLIPKLSAVRSAVSAGEFIKRMTAKKATNIDTAFTADYLLTRNTL